MCCDMFMACEMKTYDLIVMNFYFMNVLDASVFWNSKKKIALHYVAILVSNFETYCAQSIYNMVICLSSYEI
jgi:hypothetical protein